VCMGRTHAAVGAVAGAGYGEFAAHLPPQGTALLAAFTAGMAVLPDLDHRKAVMARSFGFLTQGFAWLVSKVSGGHRHGTHSLAGVAVFTALAMAAVHWRHDVAGKTGLCVLMSLAFAALLYAVKVTRHKADALAIAGALAVTFTGYGLALVGLATALGCGAHLFADCLTDEGCPLLLPLTGRHFGLPEPLAFTTQTRPESAVLAASVLALGWLAYHAITLTPHIL
jgi:membrane-bound metal-dependent hydrolase YbcI (DUF457 family)